MTDDNDDPGRKKNTDRDFKPAEGKRIDFSPRGTVGHSPAGLQGPGLGTPSKRQQSFEQVQSQSTEQEPEKDTRPVAIMTGDPDVDRQSEEEGFQLKTMDELKELAKAGQAQSPTTEQETGNNLSYAIETGNKDQDDDLRKGHNVVTREEAEGMIGKDAVAQIHGEEPSSEKSREEAIRQKAEEIAAKLNDDKKKGLDLGH